MAARIPRMSKLRTMAIVTAGAGFVFAGISTYRGNEKFYRQVIMPAVQMLPPETSHNLALLACKYKLLAKSTGEDPKNLTTRFFKRDICNPIGIAAGFDKQGEAIVGLENLGFGFVEIGSVTPEAQPGNPTPRIFRLLEDKAIINRYGFNSEGHKVVYERLKEMRRSGEFKGVLGVNLGKNKTSKSAVDDYVQGVNLFGPIADYLVVNVSSPNTPGLRDLQSKKELEKLLEAILTARNNLPYNNDIPIFLKLSPDLTKQDVKDISSVIKKKTCKVDGLIVSNTTVTRENLFEKNLANETGGLSGEPLRNKSTQLVAEMYQETKGTIPIIGVGGVSSGSDAFEKIEAGASYIQFYTALIYHGPPIVSRIKKELSQIINDKGYASVSDAVGTNYKKYLS